jgi:exosome complex exonuclease RRP6
MCQLKVVLSAMGLSGRCVLCRSFQGFTCLMQISTRSRDFIVDTLALRAHIGSQLARAFADASKLKVLHGADSDILWLQKDLGLFVVNMFDTGQAARLLGMPAGLGKVLLNLCHIQVCLLCHNHRVLG